MPYFPPSGGGSTPGLPIVIGVNAIGDGITGSVTGHGQQLLFSNGNYFFNTQGTANAANTATSIAAGGTFNGFFQELNSIFQIEEDNGAFFSDQGNLGSDGSGNLFVVGLQTGTIQASLPISDPNVSGELWSNLGIVTVSAG